MSVDVDPNYVKWVQRSLNRLFKENLVVNGMREGNAPYLDALQKFKQTHHVEEVGLTAKQIGPRCQDKIIEFNNLGTDGGDYIDWICKVVPNAPAQAMSVVTDPKLQSAVRKFQEKEKLKVDGWVGYKTEFRLIQISKAEPPGTKPGDRPKGGGLPSPWIQWFNSLNQDKRYGHMMEIAAKQYAEMPYDPNIKCLAQKLRRTELGIPTLFYFTAEKVRHLAKPLEYKNTDSWRSYEKLRVHIKPAKTGLGRAYYDPNDWAVQDILMTEYMTKTAEQFNPYYAYPVGSMSHYNQNYKSFFEQILKLHKDIDLGIGEVEKLRGDQHGEPTGELAQKVMVGLSKDPKHVYSCYKDQMPKGGVEFPF